MSSLLDKLSSARPDLCFYGLVPPKLATPAERLEAIVAGQKERLRALGADALVVYDLQDEAERQHGPRPFPFLPTVSPEVYAHQLMADVDLPKVVYRAVRGTAPDAFVDWARREQAATAASAVPRLAVLVGAPTSRAPASSPGLGLADAYALLGQHAPGVVLGGIAIAERHARRADEHERMVAKMAAGCRFFISQAVYDAGSTRSLLSDYSRAVSARGLAPAPVVLTFSPCGSTRTLSFLKWLGITVPRWLENELIDARDILETSVRLCCDTLDDVLAYARAKRIPIGINVESISISKAEIDASTALFAALRSRLAAACP